jgi:hypothetical protein
MSRNEMKLQQRAYMVALRDLIDTGRYDTKYVQIRVILYNQTRFVSFQNAMLLCYYDRN